MTQSQPDNNDNRYEDGRYTIRDNQTGEELHLRRINPTYGKPAIDISGPIETAEGTKNGGIRAIFAEVHDPANKSTSSCLSDITFIDGEQGILLHRGYNIKDLTENTNYTDVVHLLLEGELPAAQLDRKTMEYNMVTKMPVPDQIGAVIKTFDRDAAPMDILAACVNVIAAKDDDSDPEKIISQVPTIVAMIIRHAQGKNNFMTPDLNEGFTQNFVRMAFADDDGSYEENPVFTKAMDKLLILHADHEQNASTSNVRNTRSAGSKMTTSLAAGVNTLAGPLHGGANQKVLEQLQEIAEASQGKTLTDSIQDVIARAKDKDDDFRLMGFGHRVYKNRDPRAVVLKSFVDDLLNDLGIEDDRLDIARELEKQAVADPYFQDRKLYPNVDFYSGIAMAAMGLEPELFTLIFAAGRSSGWVAQAEELRAHKTPINRPRQQYVGEEERPVPQIFKI